jgi:hypothetical protein
MTHDFETSHAFGEAAGDDPLWEAFYRKAFPGLVGTLKSGRGVAAQYAGIDRWLCMSNGKTLTVDEKKRSKDYDDVALEYLSNDRTGAPGWIEKDLAIDYREDVARVQRQRARGNLHYLRRHPAGAEPAAGAAERK